MPRSSRDAPRRIKNHGLIILFCPIKIGPYFLCPFVLIQKNEKIKALNFSFSALADAYSYFKTTYNSLRPPRRKFLLLSETDIFEKCSCRNFKN